MTPSPFCDFRDGYLNNLRQVNEQAGVDPEVVDIIVAYARLRLNRNVDIDFYPRNTSSQDSVAKEFLSKNRNRDRRATRFLAAYFRELHRRGLRCIINAGHLAHILRTPLQKLNWLANEEKAHYVSFEIPKKDGRLRKIDCPKPQLKEVQRQILDLFLHRVRTAPHAHGFVKTRSILTNAQHHIGKQFVVKMDLKDFFPSISFQRVAGGLEFLGYPHGVAVLLSKLMTHNGRLPIGAPTSPAISNIVCRTLDRRFAGLGKSCGFTYSRYADDIAVSGDRLKIVKMIPFFKEVISEEGFQVNTAKTSVMRNASRQKITGVIVNEKANAPGDEIRKLRAVLHNCRKHGVRREMGKWAWREKQLLTSQYDAERFRNSLLGRINFVRFVNPVKGLQLLSEFQQLDFKA